MIEMAVGKEFSHMGSHDIQLIEGLGAIRTLPHAIGNTVFNTVVAEDVSACFQDSVLEILATNST